VPNYFKVASPAAWFIPRSVWTQGNKRSTITNEDIEEHIADLARQKEHFSILANGS